jgi:outer membrane murein-binding lipoprotein Lpp
MAGFHRPLRSATLLAAALLAVALAGCSNSNSNSNDTSHTGAHGGGTHRPVTTSNADWTSVTDALGRTGKFGDSNTVYRIPLVRSDLQVVTVGAPIKPGLSLGGYVAFAKYDDATMVMDDLVVTEAELPKVTDALQSHGIEQTALHKHLLEQSPQV